MQRTNKGPDHVGGLTRSFLEYALGTHPLAAAFLTTQTFDEGYDRRVWLNAASEKLGFSEAADMTAAQAFDAYVVSHATHSYAHYWLKVSARGQIMRVAGGAS